MKQVECLTNRQSVLALLSLVQNCECNVQQDIMSFTALMDDLEIRGHLMHYAANAGFEIIFVDFIGQVVA